MQTPARQGGCHWEPLRYQWAKSRDQFEKENVVLGHWWQYAADSISVNYLTALIGKKKLASGLASIAVPRRNVGGVLSGRVVGLTDGIAEGVDGADPKLHLVWRNEALPVPEPVRFKLRLRSAGRSRSPSSGTSAVLVEALKPPMSIWTPGEFSVDVSIGLPRRF